MAVGLDQKNIVYDKTFLKRLPRCSVSQGPASGRRFTTAINAPQSVPNVGNKLYSGCETTKNRSEYDSIGPITAL